MHIMKIYVIVIINTITKRTGSSRRHPVTAGIGRVLVQSLHNECLFFRCGHSGSSRGRSGVLMLLQVGQLICIMDDRLWFQRTNFSQTMQK